MEYENFYEPVEVTTGTMQGELIEVTEGLSVGEQLVTQGSLSLYAESRKTQTADADTESSSETTTATTPTPTDATDAQGIPDSQDASGNLVQSEETPQESSKFPLALVGGIAGGVIVLGGGMGAIALFKNSKK